MAIIGWPLYSAIAVLVLSLVAAVGLALYMSRSLAAQIEKVKRDADEDFTKQRANTIAALDQIDLDKSELQKQKQKRQDGYIKTQESALAFYDEYMKYELNRPEAEVACATAAFPLYAKLNLKKLHSEFVSAVNKPLTAEVIRPTSEKDFQCRARHHPVVKKTHVRVVGLPPMHMNRLQDFQQLILMQHPSDAETGIFWETMAKAGVKGIVMLNHELKKLYFEPKQDKEMQVDTHDGKGKITVVVTNEKIEPGFVTRAIKVTIERDGKKDDYTFAHYHYTVWEDQSTPVEDTALRRVLNAVWAEHVRGGNNVLAVHCHTGIARSGCFALMLALLRNSLASKKPLDSLKENDLVSMALDIRASRYMAIHSTALFLFAIRTVLRFLYYAAPNKEKGVFGAVAAFMAGITETIGEMRCSEYHERMLEEEKCKDRSQRSKKLKADEGSHERSLKSAKSAMSAQ